MGTINHNVRIVACKLLDTKFASWHLAPRSCDFYATEPAMLSQHAYRSSNLRKESSRNGHLEFSARMTRNHLASRYILNHVGRYSREGSFFERLFEL